MPFGLWHRNLPGESRSLKEPFDQLLGLPAPVCEPVLELLDSFGQEAIDSQNNEPRVLGLQAIARDLEEPTIQSVSDYVRRLRPILRSIRIQGLPIERCVLGRNP